MKRLLLLPLLLLMLTFGCAQNHFNVPVENFAAKVRVLGVAPIFVDADSDTKHPQKEELISLVTEMNRNFELQLVRKLKDSGSFYNVALLDGDPKLIFAKTYFRREKRNDASIQYNKYFWKNDELGELIRRNSLDAVMLVVVSGLSKTEKISSGNLLSSLTSDYNCLFMTAQIVDAEGTILWEYPNFRSRILSYDPMINLQYPDFSEAEANLSDTADIKFKTLEGIKRRFDVKRKDLLFRETQETEVYVKQFDEMVDLLKFDPAKEKQAPPAAEKNSPAAAQPRPAADPAPVSEPPKGQQAPAPAIPAPTAPEADTQPTDEIVPASGKTE